MPRSDRPVASSRSIVEHPSLTTKLPDSLAPLAAALADRYRLERELGRGGMATVYLAEDLKHHRKVAIKVLRPELAAMLGAERFLREIQVTARLTHPHILPVHDSGSAAGLLYYVMPFVEGESLRDRLRRESQLPLDDALQLAGAVADALAFAHRHGVIHRDIKPENILLQAGHAVVSDFGIALSVTDAGGGRLTGIGLALGTPAYMSPEQAMGEREPDARSDVYSLACVLYEMLAGEPPHTGATAQAMIAKRLLDPVPAVRRLRPTVPAGVDEAIAKALAKVPADRFGSVEAFAEALTRPGAGGPRLPSVAVLPFLNLSADPENEFFADGITEDVIAQLTKIRSLKVISPKSVMPFKKREQSLREIGTRLEVATLLEGSVRRSGDRVRIVAQLIDVSADRHLWAETYDRRLTDIFAIQTDVALQIASALRAELSPDERIRIRRKPTSDVQAYQLYLQGRFCYSRYTEEGMRKGIEYFRQAIAADPDYALAHVGVALAYAELAAGQGGGALKPDEAFRQARDAVIQALALDNGLGEAHSVLALLKCVHDFDWAGAEEEFRLALELSPGGADIYDHYGWLCAALERYEEAIALVKRAQELDPLMHRSDVATTLLRAGRSEEALEAALRAIEFEPDYARGRSTLGWAYLKNGMVSEGVAELKQSVALNPGNTLYLAQLGEAYGLAGNLGQAREVLRQLSDLSEQRYVSPYHMAYVHTGLGEVDRAMDYLERAYEERAGSVYGIKGSFLFTSLHSHPRFIALLRKMNLA
jgi:serine/threonine protein kinase/tetratricopeptide (TPR) repeat protein